MTNVKKSSNCSHLHRLYNSIRKIRIIKGNNRRNMVFRLFHFDSCTFILRLKMRDCEVAKAKVRRCDGEGSHFCLRLFDCILQISVDYTECDAGIVLAQGLPINLRYTKYARPSCLL